MSVEILPHDRYAEKINGRTRGTDYRTVSLRSFAVAAASTYMLYFILLKHSFKLSHVHFDWVRQCHVIIFENSVVRIRHG